MDKFPFTTEQTFLDKLNDNCYYQTDYIGGTTWTLNDIQPDSVRTYCYEYGRRDCEKLCASCGTILGELEDWRDKDSNAKKIDDLIRVVQEQSREITRLKTALRNV